MPVTFQSAEPFVPSITAAYGASETARQDLPLLVNAAESVARMRQAANQAAADRAFRAGEAGLDRAESAAGRSAQAMGNLSRVNAESQQAEFEREARQRLQANELAARAQAQQFQAEADLRARAETMQLSSWLRKQEFSYADQLELQKQERQVRSIQDAIKEHVILPEEGQREMLRLKTGIDVLRQRQQETQTRALAAQAKLAESKAAEETRLTALRAKTFKRLTDSVNYFDPAVRADVEEQMGPITQEEIARYGEQAPKMREKEIQRRTLKRQQELGYPKMVVKGLDANGYPVFEQAKPEKSERGFTFETHARVINDVESQMSKEASGYIPPEWAKSPEAYDAEFQRRYERRMRLLSGTSGFGRSGGAMAGGGAGTVPAGPPAKPYSPSDRATMTEPQRQFEDKYEQFIGRLQTQSGLSDEQKSRFIRDAQMHQTMVRKYGSLTNPARPISAGDWALIQQLRNSLQQAEAAISAPTAATATPPPPVAARPTPTEAPAYEIGSF